MKKDKLIIKALVVVVIVLISFGLRYENFDKVPFPGESMDEYSYSWVGMSLIKLGVPVGISGIDGYRNSMSRYINVDHVFQNTATGNPLTMNWPWFDHPPLLGLITGGFAISKGAQNFADASIFIIRKPMVVLGTISVFLVILFCWLNFGFLSAMVAGLIYGTMPVVVVGSRMIQGENGVIPAYLATLVLISLYFKSKQGLWLVLAGTMSGVSTLFKLSGLTVLIEVALIFWTYRKKLGSSWKTDLGKFVLLSLSISSLFVIYGFVLGWSDFITIFFSNSKRFYGIGPEAIYRLFSQVKITNTRYLTDPSVLIGWMAVAVLAFRKTSGFGEKLVVQMCMVWVSFYVFLGSYPYGWYAFPFYPLLAIALARLLVFAWKDKRYVPGVLFVWLAAIGYMISRVVDILVFQSYSVIWKLIITIAIGGSLLGLEKYFRKLLLVILVTALVFVNIYYLKMLVADFWYKVL